MAARTGTYTWTDVLNAVSKGIPKAAENDFAATICNLTLNAVWMKWDWRESLAKLPPFYLIPGQQDHGAPAVVVPADFMGLRQTYLMRLDTNPVAYQELSIIKDLRPTHVVDFPQAINYESASKMFRVFPRVPDNMGAPNFAIVGEYKIRPTKITASTMNTVLLPFDDIYYDMWIDVAKWIAYKLSGDPRAGAASYANGQTTFTGAMAEAMKAIDAVAKNEGLELGDPVIAPAEPLVSNNGFGGLGRFLGM